MTGVVYFNGAFISAHEARVSVFDRGFLYGDGLFETLRADDGRVFLLNRHVERLYAGLRALRLDIPETPDAMAEAVRETVRRNGGGDASIRVTITRGEHRGVTAFRETGESTRVVAVRPLPKLDPAFWERGVAAVTVRAPCRASAPIAGLKTISYIDFLAYKDAADRAGAFEAILVDENDRVLEGASSNVFLVKDGVLSTPPLSLGILPGVIRGFVIENAAEMGIRVQERIIAREDLSTADELFITNSIVEAVDVSSIDSHRYSLFKDTFAKAFRSRIEDAKRRL